MPKQISCEVYLRLFNNRASKAQVFLERASGSLEHVSEELPLAQDLRNRMTCLMDGGTASA